MIGMDEWIVEFRSNEEDDEYWKEIHRIQKTHRIRLLEVGEFKKTHYYRLHYLNKPFLLFIDIRGNADFGQYTTGYNYKTQITKLFNEVKSYFTAGLCGVFLGFDTLIELMECTEKIKEMAEKNEL